MADLPRGWKAVRDTQGRTYYYDTNTGDTSWNPPPPPPPDPAPPTVPQGSDSSPSAPPLSSADSLSPKAYPQHSPSYQPSPVGYPPSQRPLQPSASISAHPPAHSAPDYQGSVPLPHPQSYPSHSQSHPSNSHGYAHTPSYPTQSQPYPTQSQPYPTQSQPYPAHPPSYGAHPPHLSPPNGGPSSHPDMYGPPPPGGHRPPPPPPGGHGAPYGYPPTSQPVYSSPSQYGQQPHGLHGPPPPPPPAGYAPQPHGYDRPPSYGPPPPDFQPPPGGHPPPPPPSDYGRPPAGHGGYGQVPPPAHQLPPAMGHGSPPMEPPPRPPDGYPAAPSQLGQQSLPPHQQSLPPHQQSLPPHQQSLPPHQQSLPPHQQSYQPPPPPLQNPSQMSHVQTSMSSMTAAMSQLSMGMGPNSKVVLIGLEFRAVGLRDRDWIGKSDPVLHVLQPKDHTLDEAQVSQWKYIGSTEVVKNTVNPTWVDKVKVRYHFERHQPLRFDLVDVDNFKTMKGDKLGFATSTLAEIVRNGIVRLPVRKKEGGTACGELTIRAHDEDPTGKVRLQLSLAGKNLDKKDFMGKSDPYYKLFRVLPGSGGTSLLYKSEQKMNDCNPTWKPHSVMMPAGGAPWTQISLMVEVYDWDKYTPHDLIGDTTFALSDLIKTKTFPLINKKKQAKKGNRYKNSGELVVHRADAAELPSFISYLQGGLRLDFIVAVDFTASNRPVDNPQSLHYMGDPNHPSQYYLALHAVGTILAGYLSDGYITALGFGAKLPGSSGQASFDFALNGQADARVHGVQGLLQAYQTALSNVTLAGPTYFAPIIRNAMGVANSVPVSQTNQHFAVLLILTDGIITDLSATIDAIIDASHSTPIAIVIVGVGRADFRAMERLDGDNFKLRSDRGDKVAKHDIVQFTKYDPTKPTEYLAADVLQEVPQRVVEFMTDAGIKPNEHMGQPLTY